MNKINIGIKTFDGKKYILKDVKKKSKISELKKLIEKRSGILIDSQKLLFKRKFILDDSLVLQQLGMNNNDTMIVLKKRQKESNFINSLYNLETYSKEEIIKITTNFAEPENKNISFDSIINPSSNPNESVKFLNLFQTWLNQENIGEQSSSSNSNSNMEEENNEENEEISEEEMPTVEENALEQLMSMGFPENRAKKALILCKNNIDASLNWLIKHQNDPNIDVPIANNVLRRLAKQEEIFEPDPEVLTRLIEMGFPKENCINALKASNNNHDAALRWLLGEVDTVEDNPMRRAMNSNPVVRQGLRNPRVLQALQEILSNRAAASRYASDPEVGPVLIEFLKIIGQL
eukprot:TRINITY_DN13824_c0_g1_i1.p1 TRINITY_DN13824_c0_g1~~TRINITY_DN13824_c0_g1_i1.p1  ORF type:complete len:348 (+),score=108.76 TRINITY_DN13824_c0_g1_i1:43-1086(+)